MFPLKLVAGISCVLLAYYLKDLLTLLPLDNVIENNIIVQWNNDIVIPDNRFSTVAIGFNAAVDVIVNGTELLKNVRKGATPGKDIGTLTSVDDLESAFCYFFGKGAAAERFFSNKKQFSELIANTRSLKTTKHHIGGNAALMSEKIAELFPEAKVQLVAPVGTNLLQLLSKKIYIPDESVRIDDEYHLIMEYKVGESWGKKTAPVANRFITSHDVANGRLDSIEMFFDKLYQKFTPKLVALSGVHMLEGQSSSVWSSRLETLSEKLVTLPRDLPVHLELASMANADFVRAVAAKLFTSVDSIGLNEQELAIVSEVGGGPHVEWQGQPKAHEVLEILRWMMRTYGHMPSRRESRLARIHFHCLSFHISASVSHIWDNQKASVAAGARIAGLQACDVMQMDTNHMELLFPRTWRRHGDAAERRLRPGVEQWAEEGVQYTLSPVLVCKQPRRTVGLGDAISATGLLYSNFTPSQEH